MTSKWLWMTWAHFALAMVIILEIGFIFFNAIFIIPKFQKLHIDGMINQAVVQYYGLQHLVDFIYILHDVCRLCPTWMALVAVVAAGLFEWRVKSENKTLMRLSALGTLALGLMAVMALLSGAMVILLCECMPSLGMMARPYAQEQALLVNSSLLKLDQAVAKSDWKAMKEAASDVAIGTHRLNVGPIPYLLRFGENRLRADQVEEHLVEATHFIQKVQRAIDDKDAPRLEVELASFRRSFAPLREAAKRPVP